MNNSNNLNKKKEEIYEKEKKLWKDFKSNYTFLILALLIYSLRPLTINRNNEELSYMLEIINKKLTKENYKEELNIIIRMITSTFIKISSNDRERIIIKSSTKQKILDIINLLLRIESYKIFYSKMIEYNSSITNNKDFFKFIASLITFGDIKNSLNSETRNQYIIYLIKRISNSPLNQLISKINNPNNMVINNQIKNYKSILINIASNFFKNIIKKNNVEKGLFKNMNEMPTNKSQSNNNINVNQKNVNQKNANQKKVMSIDVSNNLRINGGSMNKSKSKKSNSKSKILIKNMWWLNKYK